MRSLKESVSGMIDLGVVLMIGIAFVGLIVVAYIMYQVRSQLTISNTALSANFNNTAGNVSTGFDNAISLILVAITIWILALAISALLLLRGRQE